MPDVLKDLDALEGCREWLMEHEQNVNVGPVECERDTLIESSAVYLVRVVDACRAAMLQSGNQAKANYPDTLPCDVIIEPATRFYKGIKTSTLLAALSYRSAHQSGKEE